MNPKHIPNKKLPIPSPIHPIRVNPNTRIARSRVLILYPLGVNCILLIKILISILREFGDTQSTRLDVI